ncbi:hypothetical protein [Mucilaginibacter flavus]|uniref:hypothetical protein n=1 Tax=Mucilaginibacter flavus TaxID=931504 RepID=UPI0025B5A6A8|nr:hypothetical protein [Mucilaginibacter flavus]
MTIYIKPSLFCSKDKHRPAHSPRERACYFFLDKKVTKKSSQQKGFFAAQAFSLQNGQNLGWNYFALALIVPHMQKLPMPCHRTAHHRSACFRPKLLC